ncbi:MAG: conjugal transfer protein TraF [Comamonadaceae bacterium]|nr:conjugal transfer protein TraF [Comamonadaceae bacterium]
MPPLVAGSSSAPGSPARMAQERTAGPRRHAPAASPPSMRPTGKAHGVLVGEIADAITAALQGHVADLHRRDHREALRPGRLQPPEGDASGRTACSLPGASGTAPPDHRLRHQLLPRRPAAASRCPEVQPCMTSAQPCLVVTHLLLTCRRRRSAADSRAAQDACRPLLGRQLARLALLRRRRNPRTRTSVTAEQGHPARAPPRSASRRPPELVEFERLQKRTRGVPEHRHHAADRSQRPPLHGTRGPGGAPAPPTFADVAQRVAWATPRTRPDAAGPPGQRARRWRSSTSEQMAQRSESIGALGTRPRAVLLLPLATARTAMPSRRRWKPSRPATASRSSPISVDGGADARASRDARRDNGIAHHAEGDARCPAVFLAQPFTGKITPIGFGVLSGVAVGRTDRHRRRQRRRLPMRWPPSIARQAVLP